MIRRTAVLLAAQTAMLATVGIPTADDPAMLQRIKRLTGHYYLRGLREAGAELELFENKRFEFVMSYGALDQRAAGRWEVRNDKVLFTSDAPSAPRLMVVSKGSDLLGSYGKNPEKETQLSVEVTSPSLGLTWSNMEIVAEFSNGKRRQGLTGNDGRLGFLRRKDGDWSNAAITRVSAAYPKADVAPVWVELSPQDKAVVFHFEPGSLTPPAFESMDLLILENTEDDPVLTPDADSHEIFGSAQFTRH